MSNLVFGIQKEVPFTFIHINCNSSKSLCVQTFFFISPNCFFFCCIIGYKQKQIIQHSRITAKHQGSPNNLMISRIIQKQESDVNRLLQFWNSSPVKYGILSVNVVLSTSHILSICECVCECVRVLARHPQHFRIKEIACLFYHLHITSTRFY